VKTQVRTAERPLVAARLVAALADLEEVPAAATPAVATQAVATQAVATRAVATPEEAVAAR
jgi:hypothetical protein